MFRFARNELKDEDPYGDKRKTESGYQAEKLKTKSERLLSHDKKIKRKYGENKCREGYFGNKKTAELCVVHTPAACVCQIIFTNGPTEARIGSISTTGKIPAMTNSAPRMTRLIFSIVVSGARLAYFGLSSP